MNKYELFTKIMSDQSFVSSLAGKAVEEVLSLFESKGLKLTKEELKEFLLKLKGSDSAGKTQLPDDLLDNIVGGNLVVDFAMNKVLKALLGQLL